MASKLSGSTLKKRSFTDAMKTAERKKEKETAEVILHTNTDKLPDHIKAGILFIRDEDLLDDPLNTDIYGEVDDINNMAAAMKEYGFQGNILAYPVENGKYRIESGHRRRAAGRLAGIKEFPVYVRTPPQTEWERKYRLLMANLHTRRESPMKVAKIAQALYQTHDLEIREKKKKGTLEENEITALNDLVARDLDLEVVTVKKYRALLKLIPELQSLADAGDISWSALTGASTLSPDQQRELLCAINDRIDKKGIEGADRKWIISVIQKKKLEPIEEKAPEPLSGSAAIPVRNFSGSKLFVRASRDIHRAFDFGGVFKPDEIPMVLGMMKELRDSIDRKIEEFENRNI